MKNILLVTCLVWCMAPLAPVQAEDTAIVVISEEHNVFKGLFQSVWARLKALNPGAPESANAKVEYTAGIRGAESIDTLLKPYWKDDLTKDEAFQAELQKFGVAQLQLDRGDLDSAVISFDGFLEEFAHSDLRPNALFGKSISLAGLGKNDASLATMRQFLDENPNHPLNDDARRVIGKLR